MGCTQSDRAGAAMGAESWPKKLRERAAELQGKTLLGSRPSSKKKQESKLSSSGLRLKIVQSYYHLSVVGLVPKPEAAHAKIEEFASDYEKALACTGSIDERVAAFMALFGTGPGIRLEDPVGTAPYVGRRAIEDHAVKIFQGAPPSAVKVRKIHFTMDDFRAAAKVIFSLPDGGLFETLDVFSFDAEYKIKSLSTHFHLSQLGMAREPVAAHDSIELFVESYVDTLGGRNGDRATAFMAHLCSDDPDIEVEDPVGTTTKIGRAEVQEHVDAVFQSELPRSTSVKNIYFTMNDKICVVEMCCCMQDGSTLTVLDKLHFEGAEDGVHLPPRTDYSRDVSQRSFPSCHSRNASRKATRELTLTPRTLAETINVSFDDPPGDTVENERSQDLLSL